MNNQLKIQEAVDNFQEYDLDFNLENNGKITIYLDDGDIIHFWPVRGDFKFEDSQKKGDSLDDLMKIISSIMTKKDEQIKEVVKINLEKKYDYENMIIGSIFEESCNVSILRVPSGLVYMFSENDQTTYNPTLKSTCFVPLEI